MPRNSTIFKITGTETFRASSSKIMGEYGSNLQNIEKSLRAIYIPDGYNDATLAQKCLAFADSHYKDFSLFTQEELDILRILIQVDQAGAEALIVAYLCKAGKFRDLFLNGIKPHVFIGLAFPHHWEERYPQIYEIAKLSIGDLKKHAGWKALEEAIKGSDNNPPATRYYYHYKQTCHSANYGIKAPTFQLNMLEKSGGKVVLTKNQADTYLSGYRNLFPEIPEWNHYITETVNKHPHTLWNLQGYPRQFTDLKPGDMKDAIAFIPQSTVGCITHIAYTNMQTHIEDNRKTKWDMLNNCHDSYLAQVPLMDWLECAKLMQTLMNQELTSPRGEKFHMKSECQIGFNWSPAKEPKDSSIDRFDPKIINKYNLNGLREVKLV